jgi:AAA family ATP:ADP antiporter
MLGRIVRFFWPDLSDQEVDKYSLLSITFFFLIGCYWLLRPLKDGMFFTMVGGKYQPIAKMTSLVIVSALVFV